MLQSPCIGNGMLQLDETDVLGAKPYIPWQQKVVLSDGGMCQQLLMVVIHLLCPVACLRHLKGGVHLLGKFLVVCMAVDLCELLPRRQHLCTPSAPSMQSEVHRRRALDLRMAMVVGVMLTLAGVGGHLLHQCLLGRAPPHPGVAAGGVQVARHTQDLHPL